MKPPSPRRLVSLVFASCLALVAAPSARAESSTVPLARVAEATPRVHLVHAELVTGIVTNGVSLNYEHTLDEHFAVRIGYGASVALGGVDQAPRTAHGPLGMLTFLAGRRAMFELAAGASLVTSSDDVPVGLDVGGAWHVVPAFAIGFRYQASGEGPMFRVAFAWTSAYGVPFSFGVGWGF